MESASVVLRRLRAVLEYKPRRGVFLWKIRTHSGGGVLNPGDVAGTKGRGRIQIGYHGHIYRAHRLAVLFMTGKWPLKGMEVDHINGDDSDNRWCNLRVVTKAQNMRNVYKLPPKNKSGQRGVSWVAHTKKWMARITVDHVLHELGSFTELGDAVAARQAAERKFFREHRAKTAAKNSEACRRDDLRVEAEQYALDAPKRYRKICAQNGLRCRTAWVTPEHRAKWLVSRYPHRYGPDVMPFKDVVKIAKQQIAGTWKRPKTH